MIGTVHSRWNLAVALCTMGHSWRHGLQARNAANWDHEHLHGARSMRYVDDVLSASKVYCNNCKFQRLLRVYGEEDFTWEKQPRLDDGWYGYRDFDVSSLRRGLVFHCHLSGIYSM